MVFLDRRDCFVQVGRFLKRFKNWMKEVGVENWWLESVVQSEVGAWHKLRQLNIAQVNGRFGLKVSFSKSVV